MNELDDDTPEGMRWLLGDDDEPRFLAPDGTPMEVMEWADLFEQRHADFSPESWWRKHTEIKHLWVAKLYGCKVKINVEARVSTVWLGINHQWVPGGTPLFWETMVFGLDDDDEYQQRYSSREAAFDDHERIVKALRAGKDPWE